MEITVERITKEEWKTFSKNAHEIVFQEGWDCEIERIDYALFTRDENKSLIQYATIRELDRDTGYLNYGGSFPTYKGTIPAYRSFQKILGYLYDNYKYVSFLTENKNLPMVKFAIKEKFLIVGMRNFKGKIFLEFFKEREE